MEIEDKIKIPSQIDLECVKEHTIRFHNCIHVHLKISTLAHILIEYMGERMSNANTVGFSEAHIKEFNHFLKTTTGKSRSSKSVRNVLTELVKVNYLVRLEPSYFMVNPRYMMKWSADLKTRNRLIRFFYEKCGVLIHHK